MLYTLFLSDRCQSFHVRNRHGSGRGSPAGGCALKFLGSAEDVVHLGR